MTDYTITGLTRIAGPLAFDTEIEVQRNGQATSEKANGADLRKFIGAGLGAFPFMNGSTAYLTNGLNSQATQAMTANRLWCVPIFIPYRRAFTKIAFELTTVQAGSHVRIGLAYSDPDSDFKPTSLVAGTDAGDFDTSVTTGKRETTFSSVTLEPGLYWGLFNSDSTPTVRAPSQVGQYPCGYDMNNTGFKGLTLNSAYGALPDLTSLAPTPSGSVCPIIGIR